VVVAERPSLRLRYEVSPILLIVPVTPVEGLLRYRVEPTRL